MWTSKPWVGYAVAVATTAIAAVARATYDWWFGPQPAYLLPFLVPVAVAGWLGGLRCGLFATVLNVVVAVVLFTEPVYSLVIAHPGDAVRIGIFAVVGVGITLLNHQLHQYRLTAERHAHDALTQQAVLEREIAERQRVERLLRASHEEVGDSERRLRLLLESLPQLVWTCTADGRCDYLSRQWVEYTGVPEAEQLGSGWAAAVHPDDRPRLQARWEQSVRDSSDYDIEFRIRAATGEYRWFKTRATLIATADGGGKWFGTCTDIHDRLAAEEELRETNATLERRVAERVADHRASEERVQLAAAAAGVGVWEWNLRTNRVHWNAQMFDLYRVTPTPDGVVPYESWSGAVLPEDLPRQVEALQATIERLGGGTRSFRIRLPDGQCRHIEAADQVRLNADGKAEWVVGTNLDVTDRLTAERALRESERRFKAIFHSQFQFIGLMTPDGMLVEANETALRGGGVSAADVLGKPFWEAGWWAGDGPRQERLREAVRRAAGGEFVRYEVDIRGADGRPLPIDFSINPFRDDAGRVVLLIPEGRDITERKSIESALRASEERFRLAVEATGMGVWDTPFPLTAFGWDERLKGIWGLSPDAAVTPASVWGLVHPDDRAEVERLTAAALDPAGAGVFAVEHRVCRHDGSVVWVSAWGQTVFTDDPSGRQPARSIGVMLDITGRKRAEAALRASEEQFRAFMDHLPLAVWATDEAGRLAVANRYLGRVLGREPADLLGKTRFDLLAPADATAHEANDRAVREAGRAIELEEDYARPDGTRGYSLSVKFPIRAADGITLIGGVSLDITERKRAEEAIRESEERFRRSFDHAPIGMALVAPDGRWLRVNRRLCEIVGYAENDLLSLTFQSITHPDDLDADLSLVRQVLDGTIPFYQMEKRYVHKDGRTVEALLAVSLVRDGSGTPLYFISQIKDITERKAAVRALAANEALLRQFIQHSPAAIAMFDREVRYIRVSDRWVTDYHLCERNIIGRSYYDVFPDLPERWKEIHRRVLAGAVESCEEDEFVLADGSTEWLQWECRPWHAQDGHVGGLMMFTQVVTARKQSEVALRASEERLRIALQGAEAGVWECTLPGWGSYWSPEYRELYGFTAEEEAAVEKWRSRVHPDDLSRIESNLAAMAEPGRDAWQQEFRLVVPGRGVRWVLDFVRVTRNPDGTPVGIGGVNIDITARKQAEELVRASLKEKEVLLKEIHHRVKNNLQIVSALLELQAGYADDPAVVEMFSESRGRVLSMAMIHERLYKSADLAKVNFTEYVAQLAADLYQTYKVSDDDIRLEADIDIPSLPIDIAIPCGLLLNELISNCLKHAFKDADRGRIRVEFRRDADGTNVLAVSDDGPGLPAGFDIHNAPSFGMQLVTTLADQLDGEIAVSVSPGTTFRLTFPQK